MLLPHALALFASQFVHKRNSQRIHTNMHSAGVELTKLTYTRLEDNLIRHRGDRLHTTYWSTLENIAINGRFLVARDAPPKRVESDTRYRWNVIFVCFFVGSASLLSVSRRCDCFSSGCTFIFSLLSIFRWGLELLKPRSLQGRKHIYHTAVPSVV